MRLIKNALMLLVVPIFLVVLLIINVDVRTDITDFFFTGHDPDSAFMINQLNADNLQRQTLLSIVHPDQSADDVVDFMDQVQTSLMQLQAVQRVWSQTLDESQLRQLIDRYSAYSVNLYSIDPRNDMQVLFESENLDRRVQRLQNLLFGPDPQLAKNLIKSDPMLLTLDWLERIRSTFSRSRNKADHSMVFVESSASGMDLNAQQDLSQQIIEIFTLTNQKFENKFTLQTTGVPVFAMAIKSQVSADISRVSTLSMLIILAIFIVIFRSAKSLILTAGLLTITVAGAVLVTQLVFGFVHGLTLALGATLMGICIDYFIHAMINASEAEPAEYTSNIVKIWPSLILGGSTTVLGYIALAVSGFPGLQQIAVFSVSGILIALILTRYSIPRLMMQFSLSLKPRLFSDKLLSIMRLPKLAFGLLAVVLMCFLVGFSGVRWSDSLDTLAPELEQLKTNDAQIRSRMTNIVPGRFIVSQATDIETALQHNEALYSTLGRLQESGGVEVYFSVYPWIASHKLQSENQRLWDQTLTAQNIKNWESALESAGFAATAFPALSKSESAQIDLKQLKTSPVWPLLSKQLISDDNKFNVVTWLGDHDIDVVKQAISSMPGVRYFSHKESLDALARDYRIKAQRMLFGGLAAIFLVLMVRFSSAQAAIKLLTPALLAIVFVFGITGLLGRPMHMIHLIGLLLTAAICVDYGIFFFENRSNNLFLTFQAITASALTSSASFASLGIAQNPALQALAWTVAPGIIVGFLLCPVILRNGHN